MQPFGQTQIANLAIVKVGGSRISSLKDNTTEANTISAVWDFCLADELRKHLWSFSIKRVEIPASSTTPINNFNFSYPLPNDLIRLIQVDTWTQLIGLNDYNNAVISQYALEGNNILSNAPSPLAIRYASMVSDTTQWDVSFVNVFASRLAQEICESITQSTSKDQLLTQGYKTALMAAVRANALEKPPAAISDGSWVIGRL